MLIVSSPGVFDYTEEVSVLVMEGDSVTLNSGVQTNQQDSIRWYYNDILIAQIKRDQSNICTDVQCNEGNERFRDRLKLDHQTGSLTIMNTRNTDTGEYTLVIISISSRFSEKIYSVYVYGVFAVETNETQSVSVMEGESVLLHTDVTEIHTHDDILWKFGAEESLIAKINRDSGIFSTYDDVPDGRFRDRLKLDHQTGSLTITNIRTEHAGLYEVKIIASELSSKTFNVSVYGEYRSF
ncbi:hypothetical protein PO909_028400 [Leuciscus waleckii]